MTTVRLEPLTMEAAVKFWQDKIQLGLAEFAKLSDEAKTMAFAVSGIAKGDELATVFNSLKSAIEQGVSYGDFKKECAAIFERRGWTGKREWRVQNIFRTNIQTAYNSGRYQKQKEQAGVFPYLQYSAVNDRRTRPTHRAMDGKIFPIDHPFWDTWYPPNGYRCRCSTLSLTEGQIKRRGLTVETEDPTNTPVEIANPVTGAKMTVQQLLPDPGFAHHPGKTVWGGLVEAGTKSGFSTMEGLAGPGDFKRPALSAIQPAKLPVLSEGRLLASGKDPDFYQAEFHKRYGSESLVKDAIREPVIFTYREGLEEIVPLLQEMIEQPYEIWLTPQQDASGRIRLAKSYIGLWRTESDEIQGAVLEVSSGVLQEISALGDLAQAEEKRRGLLLYQGRPRP